MFKGVVEGKGGEEWLGGEEGRRRREEEEGEGDDTGNQTQRYR